jgi:glycosyltransferase involved in cell wall biosynthesis
MERGPFALNIPINSTSLGQVSLAIAREIFLQGLQVGIFPISKVDLSTQKDEPDFTKWLEANIKKAHESHSRDTPIFKLWHLNGSLESFSKKQVLFSFYEVDQPTNVEANIVKNNDLVLFSSNYSISAFEKAGLNNLKFVPLGFDKFNFRKTARKQKTAIQFGLFGKLEPQRKRHLKTLSVWAKRYGNNPKYALNCAIFNHFIDPKIQSQIIHQALEGKQYWNINFLPFLPQNELFNDLLNNTDIVLAMSGGEGWGLPEFQAVAMGSHCVGLNAHAYKDWMTEENCVLVAPSHKIPVYDNMFFKQGSPFNQGEIYDWDDLSLIRGMEEAEKRFLESPENSKGLELQEKFSYKNIVDNIISIMKEL